MKKKKILITGGAGYIGSHIVEFLLSKNYEVYVVDNLSRGYKIFLNKKVKLINLDIKNVSKINEIIKKNDFKTIIHLAALTDVQESEQNRRKYYTNNIIGTEKLLKACKGTSVKNIIYSSSAGVYGNSKSPVKETSKLKPINYYAFTKLIGEKKIIKFSRENKIQYLILRYFNVCGASKSGKIGILNNKNKSLFKVLSNQSLKKKPEINLFGKKFDTEDGSCLRDFIHVADLANIHFELIKYTDKSNKSHIINCGYGKGYTVLQIINAFKKVIKKNIKINIKEKRKGEIAISYSNNKKLIKLINWKPKFSNLKLMVKSSLTWEKNLQKMKSSK